MASSGSPKDLSVRHEESVARRYGGVRSPSSGASVRDQGDVRTPTELIECKHTGTFDRPAKSISLKLKDIEKIADEAWSEGKQPVVALRIYAPSSVLSDRDGMVDLTVRLQGDDLERGNDQDR